MIDVTRAWKDEDYLLSLSEAERAALPENPVGVVDLRDEQLNGVAGGSTWEHDRSMPRIYCKQ
jgi:mersacidin/lichenicidin family type 2 lantibiotic